MIEIKEEKIYENIRIDNIELMNIYKNKER